MTGPSAVGSCLGLADHWGRGDCDEVVKTLDLTEAKHVCVV